LAQERIRFRKKRALAPVHDAIPSRAGASPRTRSGL
jgi:hypothetical protein